MDSQTEKAKVTIIELERWEGPIEECGKKVTVETFAQASSQLARWARNAPDTGGYDKTGFKVTWANGQTYEGRVDLQRGNIFGYHLGSHMQKHLEFYAGLYRPPHITEEQYAAFLAGNRNGEALEATTMLKTLTFEDA
jgi:hypothetical protein